MPFPKNPKDLRLVETMLVEEMSQNGHITVRMIDKIHATTGLRYATISEIARRVEERTLRNVTA
jgi:hypothetical protein